MNNTIKEYTVLRSKNLENFADQLKINLEAKNKLEREIKYNQKNLKATNKTIDILHSQLIKDFKKW